MPDRTALTVELARLADQARALEPLVIAGAAACGPDAMKTAQQLDALIQSLEALAPIAGAADDAAFETAISLCPLADMAARLCGSADCEPVTGATELF
jgi:hypothetical protein